MPVHPGALAVEQHRSVRGRAYPGELHADGTITIDRIPYWAMAGTLSAVVVRWAPGTDPQRALDGWDTHPLTGREQAFFPSDAGITVNADWTSAIIRHPAEMTLTPSLRLRWSWRVDALPSRLPEDTALTHDYLSVALEFADGQDLSWYWSCCLPKGCSYRCPLPRTVPQAGHAVGEFRRIELVDGHQTLRVL